MRWRRVWPRYMRETTPRGVCGGTTGFSQLHLPLPEEGDLEDRDYEYDGEEHEGQGRPVPLSALAEGDAVDDVGDRLGSEAGTSVRHDGYLVEDFHPVHEGESEVDGHRARDEGEDDARELPQSPRPVDARRLHEFLGHSLERGEVDDHVVSRPLPDNREDNRGNREARVAEPVRFQRREAQFLKHSVDDAEVVVVHDRSKRL